MSKIKAIETLYNGYRFRSRLEARWAVFFDAAGVKYEYEPEGFDLGDGIYYLPDFYLPDLNYYAEVKGKSEHIIKDLNRVKTFVLKNKTAIMILSEIPYDTASEGLYWIPMMYYTARSGGTVNQHYGFFLRYLKLDGTPERTYFQDDFALGMHRWFAYTDYYHENNPYVTDKEKVDYAYQSIQAISGAIYDDKEFPIKDHFREEIFGSIQPAIAVARQARFEHGETPTI